MVAAARRLPNVAKAYINKAPTYEPLPPHIAKALIGRPTGYKAEFCQQLLELAAEGYSLVGFAGVLGVSRRTINEWIDVHPDFSQACQRAASGRMWFWETKLIHVANTGGTGSQGQVAIFGVVNAARTADDMRANPWLHKAEIEHSGQISLSGVVDRMFERLNALAKGDTKALTIEHDQGASEQTSFDLFDGMDT